MFDENVELIAGSVPPLLCHGMSDIKILSILKTLLFGDPRP